MYDLGNSRAVRRGEAEQMRSGIVEQRTGLVRKQRGRGRLCTIYNTHDGPRQAGPAYVRGGGS